MGQQGKPPTLTKMKLLAHAIDSHHWEWLHERSHSDNLQPKSDNKLKSTSKTKTNPSDNPARHTHSTSISNHTNTQVTPSPSRNSIANKLGNDGKLTPEERQWHFDNDLCLVGLVTSPRIVKMQLYLLPKWGPMWLKLWKKTKMHLLKANLPSGLCTDQELCYGLLCSYGGTPPYASTPSYPYNVTLWPFLIFSLFFSPLTIDPFDFLTFFFWPCSYPLFLWSSVNLCFPRPLVSSIFLTSIPIPYSSPFLSPDLCPFTPSVSVSIFHYPLIWHDHAKA